MSGIDLKITRRDFLGAMLLGSGALLLDLPAPMKLLAQDQGWEGFGGVGDYASSHGNTEEIVSILSELQRGKYKLASDNVIDTWEIFDLVVVGGGLSGLGAAYQFKKTSRDDQKCIIIENHPIFELRSLHYRTDFFNRVAYRTLLIVSRDNYADSS